MAGCATPTSSAGHATYGAPINPELTSNPAHSSGADHVETTKLAFEAQHVIGTRLTHFAMGRGTAAEASLMLSEKTTAIGEAAVMLGTGGSARSVVRHYRKKVRANTRRLRKK